MTHTPGCQQGTGPARNEGAPCALCAAAPDLLAALKALEGWGRNNPAAALTANSYLQHQARAAIAKAEGA